MNNLNKIPESIDVKQERENLLGLNYDKIYGAYEVISETDDSMELKPLENGLVAYANQIENLVGLDDNQNISILDLIALTKGEIKVLAGPEIKAGKRKIVMASGGMMDFFIPNISEKNPNQNVHMITSLRDASGVTSENQRTTVAGRIARENIREEIEVESAEEAPFLGLKDGKYYLAIGNENFGYLKESVRYFLYKKYKPEDEQLTQMFERSFNGVKYKDLGKILTEIIENDRFVKYDSEELNDVEGLEHIRKKVKIGNYEDNLYVVLNDKLNTYEFKVLKRFTGFPAGFTLLGKRFNRFFLESFHQSPKGNRIENSTSKTVNPSGAIKVFCGEIVKNVDKITSSMLR